MMSGSSIPFRRGSKVRYGGQHYIVEEWDGRWVTLVSDGYRMRVGFVDLITSPHFSPVELGADDQSRPLLLPENAVPKQVLERAYELLAVLNEMRTGFRSGDPDAPLPHEPRPQYDPATTSKGERVSAAAEETGKGGSTLRNAVRAFDDEGIVGLIDKRYLRRPPDPIAGLDQRLIDQIKHHALSQAEESTPSRKRFMHEVRRNCEREYGVGMVPVPGAGRLAAAIAELTRGMGLFGSSRRRRDSASKPETPYSYRPLDWQIGASVIIDSTGVDVMVVDPVTLKRFAVELVAAIDRATRRCVAILITPVGPNRVEAALLLLAMLRPLQSRPEWGDAADDRYCGVPRELVVPLLSEHNLQPGDLADGALITPLTVTVDNAWIYRSRVFVEACRRLRISIIRARKHTPTDKAIMERFFGTLKEDLLKRLPGSTGGSIEHRGANVEDKAWLFVPELEALVEAWLVRVYHQRPHDGLRLPHVPHRELSPNEMYDELVRIGGCVYLPPSPDLYFELLPVEWRTIQSYGVELHYLVYDDRHGDDPLIDELRHRTSPYRGVNAGKWPVRYDPRDRSRVFLQHPDTGEWGALPWVHAVGPERPFTDSLLVSAKRIAAKEVTEGRPPKEHFAKIVNALIDQAKDNAVSGQDARRARRDRVRTDRAAKDRPPTIDANHLHEPAVPEVVSPDGEANGADGGLLPMPIDVEPLPPAWEGIDA
jgi:transposase InsO family protein